MAFCPNCGTPNTEQAEKCVACAFELSHKQKAKFKGTIMMSGIKATGGTPSLGTAPTAPPPYDTAPQAAAPSLPPPKPISEPPPAGGRSANFQKTMVGHIAPPPAAPGGPTSPGAPRSSDGYPISAPGPSPQLGAPRSEPGAPLPHTRFGTTADDTASRLGSLSPAYGEPGSPGYTRSDSADGRMAGFDSTLPPDSPSKPNPSKVLAIGCIGAAAVFCIVSSLLYYALGSKVREWLSDNDDSDAEAVAWQASMTQALTQVAELCSKDCQEASPYFHARKQAALLGESKLLTPERVSKLGDIPHTKAEMLHRTDDAERATELGLDPQQCARVIAGTAKVISCSVPEPGSPRSVLRIVHLSGIGTL